MKATIKGLFIETIKGVSKSGKEYVKSVILVGEQCVTLWDCDLSSHKKFDEVTLPINVVGDNLRIYYNSKEAV